MKLEYIICVREDGTEAWIDYSDISAIYEYKRGELIYSKIILKSGVEIEVDDRAEDIHKAMLKHVNADDSVGYFVEAN